jgi:uncharacterized ferritin-like protein (DUF455 family)
VSPAPFLPESGLFAAARACLLLDEPSAKCAAVASLQHALADSLLRLDESTPVELIAAPGRPARPELVEPARVPRRRLGSDEGRAALVHAVAHIEFNAINLALDAVYRFRGMPPDYYRDWVSVAADEARHFQLVVERLAQLGCAYGDFPAHNGLWEMAEKTAHSCLQRMALVPRVLEARGLDVTPGMMQRLEQAGDAETVAVLAVILDEEVRHVEIGSRWFRHCCAEEGVDPESTFFDLLELHYGGALRGPFNNEARRRAGFTAEEMARLGGVPTDA